MPGKCRAWPWPFKVKACFPQGWKGRAGQCLGPAEGSPSVVWLGQGQASLGRVFAARGALAGLKSRDDAVTLIGAGNSGGQEDWRKLGRVSQ